MNQRSYLDYNATAPLRAEVREAVAAALSLYGNPSSVHAEGRAARAAIEAARVKVAALVGARPEDVIFTSGGTEANALALAAAVGRRVALLSVGSGASFGARRRTLLSRNHHLASGHARTASSTSKSLRQSLRNTI